LPSQPRGPIYYANFGNTSRAIPRRDFQSGAPALSPPPDEGIPAVVASFAPWTFSRRGSPHRAVTSGKERGREGGGERERERARGGGERKRETW
jgi:hypothetical protein